MRTFGYYHSISIKFQGNKPTELLKLRRKLEPHEIKNYNDGPIDQYDKQFREYEQEMKEWLEEILEYLRKAKRRRFKYKVQQGGQDVWGLNGLYYGESENWKPHGVGVLLACYHTTETIGEWKDGQLHGRYCRFHPKLSSYTFEQAVDGKEVGMSVQISVNGKKQRFYKDGEMYGQARNYSPDFRYYHRSIYDGGSVVVRGKRIYIQEDDIIFYK